jgi:hypothetical protein
MAEYFAATLYVPRHLITPEIAAMIQTYRKEFPDTEESEADGIYCLYSPEARWGQFDEIEKELVQAGIPFDRETSAYEPDPSYKTNFRPGLTPTPRDVEDVIDVQVVKDLFKSGGLGELLAKDYPDFPPLKEVVI